MGLLFACLIFLFIIGAYCSGGFGGMLSGFVLAIVLHALLADKVSLGTVMLGMFALGIIFVVVMIALDMHERKDYN